MIAEKVRKLFELNKKRIQPQPHELVQEWDGKIDGFLLINQIMKLKNDLQNQKAPLAKGPSLADRFHNKSEGQKGVSGSFSYHQDKQFYAPQPTTTSSAYQNQTKAPEPTGPKYEVNPKLKLSRKPDKPTATGGTVYYEKKEQSNTESKKPLKAINADELESQFVKKAEQPKAVNIEDLENDILGKKVVQAPKAVNVEDLERGLTECANQTLKVVNAEDLERDLVAKPQPQPTDIEEIEAAMMKQHSK